MANLLPFLRRLALAPLVTVATEATIAQTPTPISTQPANTPVERTFLERTAISAADERCDLFTEGERLALASGRYQVRNELLRANYDPAKVHRLGEQVSANARSLGCEHPSVTSVAATIRDSYRQYVKTKFMEFPGLHGFWEASRSEHDAWAIREVDKESGAIIGLRRVKSREHPDGEFQLAVSLPAKGRTPTTVQLYMRDPTRLSDPWLGSLIGSTGKLSVPPRSVAKPEWAARQKIERDVTKDRLFVYYFSKAAIERIEQLDPREAVAVEITPSPHETNKKPTRVYFEVGDFTAAHRFALIPKPEYAPIPGEGQSGGKNDGH